MGVRTVLAFVGRCMLASLFILSGCMKLASHEENGDGPVVAYMQPKLEHFLQQVQHVTGLLIPLEKDMYPLVALVAGLMEVVGGALFVLNCGAGAVILIIFLVPTTIIMHNFWVMEPESPGHQIEFINFMKNLCLCGAFLMYTSMPSQRAVAVKVKRL